MINAFGYLFYVGFPGQAGSKGEKGANGPAGPPGFPVGDEKHIFIFDSGFSSFSSRFIRPGGH